MARHSSAGHEPVHRAGDHIGQHGMLMHGLEHLQGSLGMITQLTCADQGIVVDNVGQDGMLRKPPGPAIYSGNKEGAARVADVLGAASRSRCRAAIEPRIQGKKRPKSGRQGRIMPKKRRVMAGGFLSYLSRSAPLSFALLAPAEASSTKYSSQHGFRPTTAKQRR